MDRMACVDLPALPLQILLRSHRDWITHPVAVVDRDMPHGAIQWVNEQARTYRIVPGMRYAAGLSLARDLRAGVVPDSEIADESALIIRRLWCFSPNIEPSAQEPGIFWLDASGLLCLYASLDAWALAIQHDLREAGFQSVVAVGFSRFGSYAAAKAHHRNIVFYRATHERECLRAIPIHRLRFELTFQETLLKLGLTTLGGFIDLPASGIRKRFGSAAHELHQLARGDGWTPLNPQPRIEPVERHVMFDHVETDRERLLASIDPLLQSMLGELSGRHESLASLTFSLVFDNGEEKQEQLSPATPTLNAKQLFWLIRFRMESLSFPAGVVALTIQGTGASTTTQQYDLYHEAPRRSLESAHRAFATIRAELGNHAVMYARLYDGHKPEACFGWEPLNALVSPNPRDVTIRPLVRRMYSLPRALPSRPHHEPNGWLVMSLADGPVDEVIGPHLISGEWWTQEMTRAYYYVHTHNGRWLWIYKDLKQRQWYLQGEVE